jgi:membrane fusion protein
MPLFRQESLRSQDRLHGEVNLAPPISWQVIAYGMVTITIAFLVFISLASYARIATAEGVIESSSGTVRIATERSGIISRLLVKEGQFVKKGQPLAIIRHETITAQGSLESQRIEAAEQERLSLEAKAPSLRIAAEARMGALNAEIRSAQTDQIELGKQIEQQRQLVASAEQDLAKVREVAARGFISQRDIRIREESLVNRRQELSRLNQARSAASSAEASARQRISQEQADMMVQMNDIQGAKAALAGRNAQDENAKETILLATADGIVIGPAITGQQVPENYPIMDIIPDGGKLQVRMNIPSEAVATVSEGQTARVSIDAFPYQTYGTIEARLTQVSTAAVETEKGSAFVALAGLKQKEIVSYGKSRPLRPGMKVTARIKTMERTLAQWLLDPIYAVTKR